MCGRYVRKTTRRQIAEWFGADDAHVPQFVESYNVAPQSFQPVVRVNRATGQREIALMRWGLVPYWAKDVQIGYSTINAKAETITTAPAFREAIQRRRCLVPADAFYEWQQLGGKAKQSFAIAMKDGAPYAFAGVWERWKDNKTQQYLETFAIITTDANPLLEPLHDRMPVIIEPGDYERWLMSEDPELLPLDLLRPYPAEQMVAWKVDSRVGNAKNDDPHLMDPPAEEPRLFR